MDNFTIWVDAPSEALIETPLDDESNCFLREEIQQTQQYVIEKLDEQKNCEQEKGEQTDEETTKASKILSLVTTEGKRSKDISRELVDLQEACKLNEIQLVSIQKNSPDFVKLCKENYDQDLIETNNALILLHDNFTKRQSSLNKLQQAGLSCDKEEAKKECKKLRSCVLEAKQKHEKLLTLRGSVSKLKNEFDEAMTRQKKERESIEKARAELKNDQDLVNKMTEECVNLRSQLVQIEAAQSQNQVEADQMEVQRLQNHAKKIRQETEELIPILSKIENDTKEAQKAVEVRRQNELNDEELIKTKKEAIAKILLQKIQHETKKSTKNMNLKKIVDLKRAISKESLVLANANKVLDEMKPDNKTVNELKREISVMRSEIRGYEKEIREATKENGKLIEQIAEMRTPSPEATSPRMNLNDTVDFNESEYSEQMAIPEPIVNITPVQRIVSHDVFTGAPLMTSTPLPKTAETSVKTRAAARRLEQTAATKTAEIRKKRGGKK
ncbi:CRE-SYP-1 protein [Caenorhabditis remanei]|uniref:CRE-SYP-1 protein n=1 Tax=Caenorhabditis remanei TaxID=31234 RepID=E3M4Q2_CAERE|nr:CRE-SYP-1 protein [Caenorhabditis remanei]